MKSGAAENQPARPGHFAGRWRLVVGLTILFVLACVAARWDSRTGFTELIRFGAKFERSRLPELRSLPIKTMPGGGYDGQFYAQLAVSPDVFRPEVQEATVHPAYRARRIILPLIAHVLGGGDPWRVLQVYALLNTACWLAWSMLLLRMLAPLDGPRLAVWLACVLNLAVLDSVRESLTDLPAVLLMTVAIFWDESGRRTRAAAALAFSGLVRETALVGVIALIRERPRRLKELLRIALKGALVAAPLLLLVAWLHLEVDHGGGVRRGQFEWPFVQLADHLVLCVQRIAAGDWDGRYTFGIIGALGLAYQSWFLLRHPQWNNAWWRSGIFFAVMFWFLAEDMWRGYWGSARVVLPMTLAFNLSLPRDRWFWLRLVGSNLCLLHGVWRMLP
jgi:hypothetical protein